MTTSNPHPEQLEQFGDSIPSQPSTSAMSAAGNLPAAQGISHAPSFVNAGNGSVPEASCPLNPSQQPVNELNPTSVTSLASSFPAPNVGLGLKKAFSLGPGRSPIPHKLIAKILFYKFVDLTELLPEKSADAHLNRHTGDRTLGPKTNTYNLDSSLLLSSTFFTLNPVKFNFSPLG